ncbi:MAG: arylesterase [Alphaproteobacteria bacterium]|nr:arylesterase [Alphaproteobacteria bacterium]
MLLAARPNARAEPVILALGTSLTAGYGLDEADGFTAQLSRALADAGHPARIVNGGVSGDTSAGGLARLDWLIGGGEVTHAIVELGSNDALRGLAPAQTEANLDEILRKLKDRHIEVLLAGMLAPPNLGPEYGSQFAAIYPRLAERYDVALYPFFLDGVAAEADLNQRDGIHPNADGVAAIVRRMLPYAIRLIDAQEGGASP